MRHPSRKNRGFTLTEIAIVLGIVGLLLGAIWTAAANVYQVKRASDIQRKVIAMAENFRTFYHGQSAPGLSGSLNAAQNYANMITMTDTDLCNGVPCATSTMLAAGILPADFVMPPPNNILSGTQIQQSYGVPSIYITAESYPEWLGVYDCDTYTEWEVSQGNSETPLCSGKLVIELDLDNIPSSVCMYLLMNLVNAQVDNLISIATPVTGWGPVTYAMIGGSPTLPSSMDAGTAAAACEGTSDVSYDLASGGAQLWMMFTN